MRPRTILVGLSFLLVGGMFAMASANDSLVAPRSGHDTAGSQADYVGYGPARGKHASAAAGPSLSAADALELSAADLWMSYAGDPAEADRLFRGKSLAVSGTVLSVERDFDGSMLLRLSTGDPFESVNARMAVRNQPQLLSSKGKQISLLCVGRGVLIGAPSLGGCVVR